MKITDCALQRNECDRTMTNPVDGMGGDTPEWDGDMWQTPDDIAQMMAKLVKKSDRWILEPSAGSGQIVKYLPSIDRPFPSIHAIEKNYGRCKVGRSKYSACTWHNDDFLSTEWDINSYNQILFDLIIGNPPFSLCLEFIERSLTLLNPENPEARILFLLPGDWNASHKRGNYWRKLDAHIHHKYQIQGRVPFLDADGIPRNKRQIYDAVWDIRPGKSGGVVSYLDEVAG